MQPSGDNAAIHSSDVALCIRSLTTDGHAIVSVHPSTVDDSDAVPLLQDMDTISREELGLDLPAFRPDVALWAARLFQKLCLFIVCRDIPAETIKAVCNTACPAAHDPDTDWSADLMLRHLPNLFQLACRLSNADPLVEEIRKIAADWPLSSVGIPKLEKLQMNSFIEHPGLRRLYADRILASGDTSRLGDARLDDTLRADLGIHRQLVPIISAKLFENADDTR